MTLLWWILIAGGLLYIVGALWMLVEGFRQSILWGLGLLLLPFVHLVFLFKFWEIARAPFIAMVLGGAIVGGALAVAPDPDVRAPRGQTLLGRWWKGVKGTKQKLEDIDLAGEPPAPVAHSEPVVSLERRVQLAQDIARQTAALEAEYRTLASQREKLKPGDQAALQAYNAAAARYSANLQELKGWRAELEGKPSSKPVQQPVTPRTDAEIALGYRDAQLTEVESERATVTAHYQAVAVPLLTSQAFGQLEQIATGLRQSLPTCGDGSLHLSAFYDALGLLEDRASDAAWQERLAGLSAWMKQQPKSVTARLALATCYLGWAYRGRGGKYVNATTPGGAKLFRERLERCTKTLEEARRLEQKCPILAEAMLLTSAFAKTWDRAAFDRNYREAQKNFPTYCGYALAKTMVLSPQAFGKPGEMQAFVEEAANSLGGSEGDVLYARLAWGVEAGRLFPTLSETRLDWPRVRRGLQEILRRQPKSVGAASQLCSLCLLYGETGEARTLFKQIGPVIDLSVFKSRERFLREREAAMRER